MIGELIEEPINKIRGGRFFTRKKIKVHYYGPNLAGSNSSVRVRNEWVKWRKVNNEEVYYWVDDEAN